MKVATVVPVGPGREANLLCALGGLLGQTRMPDLIVVVLDGPAIQGGIQIEGPQSVRLLVVQAPKHEPGLEQPRNIGVRVARATDPDLTHVHFLDSDVVLEETALEELELAVERGDPLRTVVAPYDWLNPGLRPDEIAPAAFFDAAATLFNDQRWEMFRASPPEKEYRNDLSAGLACFSGNLLWNIDEFQRVGGFWSEIHHGRCEDGELGLRAVAMGVPISFQSTARGYHLAHAVNMDLARERNARDVPMLNDRHPWVERGAVFMVDRDGAAFDVHCDCGQTVTTIGWWEHAASCPHTGLELPVPATPDQAVG